jgi:hypothetical protein
MSTATPTAPPAPAPFAQLTESFLCTNESCGSAIRREHLASNIDPSTGVRTVRGWCEHCDRLHEAKFRLRGEQWELIGAVEVITDARRRAQFLARIAHVRGGAAAQGAGAAAEPGRQGQRRPRQATGRGRHRRPPPLRRRAVTRALT